VANASELTPVGDDELAALFQALDVSRGIVLGVSGGSDSMALMQLFARWCDRVPRFSNSLVVTVDHGLRLEAAAEADFVARQARQFGLRHQTARWLGDKPKADLQNAARIARYRLLCEAARADGADTLVTAHTLDDQAETFLLALARGSGVYGLSGMPSVRRQGDIRICRPLLAVPKARLTATLVAAGGSWCEDPSNQDDRYRRVTMRRAGAELAALGLSASTLAETAARLGRAAAALDVYADRLIAAAIAVHPGGYLEVDVGRLAAEPEEVALRVLARALRALTGAVYVPRFERLQRLFAEIIAAVADGGRLHRTLAGATAHMPAAVSAPRRLWLLAEAGRTGFAAVELRPGETVDWGGRMRIALSPSAAGPLTIRALGPAARRLLAERAPSGVPVPALATLASAWRDDRLVAVLGLPDGADAAAVAAGITVRPLIGDRLAAAST